MLLGQLFAIPVALNLFYVAIILHPAVETMSVPQKDSSDSSSQSADSDVFGAPRTVWVPILGSLLIICAIPYIIETSYAFTAIITMHALLFVPLVSLRPKSESATSSPAAVAPRWMYILIALLSAAIRVQTILPQIIHAHIISMAELFSALNSNPAQANICLNVLWMAISWYIWSYIAPGGKPMAPHWNWMGLGYVVEALYPLQSMAFLSQAVTAPLYPAGDEL